MTLAQHPEIASSLMVGGCKDIATALGTGRQADLAITYDLRLGRAFLRRELALLPLEAVVHAGHAFVERAGMTVTEVAAEPIMLTDRA